MEKSPKNITFNYKIINFPNIYIYIYIAISFSIKVVHE